MRGEWRVISHRWGPRFSLTLVLNLCPQSRRIRSKSRNIQLDGRERDGGKGGV